MNKEIFWKAIIFIVSIILAVLLYFNRFGFAYTFWIDNYSIENEMIHIFEHLTWGFWVPLFLIIMPGIFSFFKFPCWKLIFGIGAGFVFIVLTIRLYENQNLTQLFRSIFDVIGVMASYSYIKWIIGDENDLAKIKN